MDSHSGAWCERSVSLAILNGSRERWDSRTSTLSPARSWYDGDVGRPAVDGKVAVVDELAGLRPRRCEAHPVDDVVEPELEVPEEALAGDAGAVLGVDEVVPELSLEDAVDAADLLLLTKLEAVLADLPAPDPVLAGGRRTALEGALLRVAAGPLQEELGAFPAAETADGSGVSGHWFLSPLRPGAAWGRGSRCGGWA